MTTGQLDVVLPLSTFSSRQVTKSKMRTVRSSEHEVNLASVGEKLQDKDTIDHLLTQYHNYGADDGGYLSPLMASKCP